MLYDIRRFSRHSSSHPKVTNRHLVETKQIEFSCNRRTICLLVPAYYIASQCNIDYSKAIYASSSVSLISLRNAEQPRPSYSSARSHNFTMSSPDFLKRIDALLHSFRRYFCPSSANTLACSNRSPSLCDKSAAISGGVNPA
jgi:hypothetical protein